MEHRALNIPTCYIFIHKSRAKNPNMFIQKIPHYNAWPSQLTGCSKTFFLFSIYMFILRCSSIFGMSGCHPSIMLYSLSSLSFYLFYSPIGALSLFYALYSIFSFSSKMQLIFTIPSFPEKMYQKCKNISKIHVQQHARLHLFVTHTLYSL